jgi:urea transport system substrate-binding protein
VADLRTTVVSPSFRRNGFIPVGILHSLTGYMAWSESPVVDATLLAIEEINQRGGVLGRRIQPLVVDGRSDERTFSVEAKQLITENSVCTLFGCWTSASRKMVLPIVEQHDHLLVYPTRNEGLEQSPNILYTGATPNQQVIPAVRWACSSLRKKRFFLVGSNSIYSHATNAIIRDEVDALGGEIVGEEYLPPLGADVAAVTRTITRSKPDLIFSSVAGDSNVHFTRALRAAGVTPGKVPTVYFCISEIELLSFSAREVIGDYAAWNYFQSLDSLENQAFVNRFRTRYGLQRAIADPMEAGYIGVHLWARAIEAAGSDDIPAIRQALRNMSLKAPEGPVQIDQANQHTWKTVRLGKVIEGGQFEVIWSSEGPIRPEPFPSSRPPSAWRAFLEDLYKRWHGHWTKPYR